VQSCQVAGARPFEYLKHALIFVATHPQRLTEEMTPKDWGVTFGRHLAAA
jgi:hypothetical protein